MPVREEVARALSGAERVVLAVSGGCDSMVLLHAAAAAARPRIAAVATFDHGTGAAATRAAARVVRAARALGLPVRTARAARGLRGEAAWREARWRFLRGVAGELDARVATAHTQDDQAETVILRVLRGSGARGLAGLYAGSDVLRPLLASTRAEVEAYARAHGVRFTDDPSNASRAHLRNRIRLDLRPALERVAPGFSREMLALARRAAALRGEVDAVIDATLEIRRENGVLSVARAGLLRYDENGLSLLWPAVAARAGIALDRRGLARLVALTREGRAGARIQLAGGYEALLHREQVLLRRARAAPEEARALRIGTQPVALGAFRIRRAASADGSLWSADLPVDAALSVRAWRPGDRMTPAGADGPRRVKRLLRDAGIDAARRAGWPVVLAGAEIAWIPGVRRVQAAAARSGRPLVTLCCERIDDR